MSVKDSKEFKSKRNNKFKTMPIDYGNGKIYELYDMATNEMLYVGSTVQALLSRLRQHKRNVAQYTTRKIYKHIKDNNIEIGIRLIEEYPCENKQQLHRREGEIQRDHKDKVLNMVVAGRNSKEWKEQNKGKVAQYRKEYEVTNKEVLAEKARQYRAKNKEKVLESCQKYKQRNKEQVSQYNKEYREEHKALLAEKRRLYKAMNKEKMAEKSKEYRKKNKEKITERNRQYTANNKEKVAEWKRHYKEKAKGK